MALSALTRLADRNENVRLVTGLPISYYRRHRNDLTELLQGKHAYARYDSTGARHDMAVTVHQVRVIPQPFGSLFNHMLSNSAEIGDKRFAQEKSASLT